MADHLQHERDLQRSVDGLSRLEIHYHGLWARQTGYEIDADELRFAFNGLLASLLFMERRLRDLEEQKTRRKSSIPEFSAAQIKALRESLGLTQRQFAERLSISQTYFWQLETGRVKASERLRAKLAEQVSGAPLPLFREALERIANNPECTPSAELIFIARAALALIREAQ